MWETFDSIHRKARKEERKQVGGGGRSYNNEAYAICIFCFC
jgi:hypothetical protein